ncbi:ribosomal protein L21p, putative [Bodo saltans]|uniref:Large ribosomal subunit protein bL21m n=1 Tax=Bodo saltans TaxID=75058 RepID=A0A0S4J1N8_BODSA|nr:ribosomal protein L21p, putative [Bodo saltans]|eukprot:CUG04736.1 ribosomal protein L21p, putative [Bodo saltans]
MPIKRKTPVCEICCYGVAVFLLTYFALTIRIRGRRLKNSFGKMFRTFVCRVAAAVGTSPVVTAGGLPLDNSKVQQAVDPLVHQGPKFAVIGCGNMQYKVSVGDVIAVQRMRVEIGSRITIKKVHMVGGERFTAIGRPLLENVRVVADVEEQKRMRSVISYYADPGKRQTRLVEQQHPATILRIREIDFNPSVVGELDKYDGVLQDPATFNAKESPNKTYWANEVSEDAHGKAY